MPQKLCTKICTPYSQQQQQHQAVWDKGVLSLEEVATTCMTKIDRSSIIEVKLTDSFPRVLGILDLEPYSCSLLESVGFRYSASHEKLENA